jgi:large repetitive protein
MPSLPITIGGITRQARYDAAASGGSTAVFTYTIVAGDSATGLAGSVTVGSTIALNGGTIRDTNLNDASLAVPATPVNNVVVNRLTAAVTASADKTYKIGDVIELTATFTQPVNVVGAATIQATIATTTTPKTATFNLTSGNGTSALKFRYTVVANDLDTDGIDVNGAFTLGAGITIRDFAGNDVVNAFSPPTTTDILVDGVAPAAMTAIVGPTSGTYFTLNNDVLRFTVPFNDVVTVTFTNRPTLTFTLGSNNIRQAEFAGTSGSTGNTLEFTYSVRSADAGTQVSVAPNAINLNGSTIHDANGNTATLTLTAETFEDVIVNQVVINAITLASTDNRFYRAGESVLFDVSFSSPVTVTGTPAISLELQTGSGPARTVTANWQSGNGTTNHRFAYRVLTNDLDLDGVQFASASISGGTMQAAGGPVVLSFLTPDISGVRIDAQSPTIPGAIGVPAAGNYRAGDVLQFAVTFSEPMTVTPEAGTGNVPRIPVVIGSKTEYANFVAGSATNVLQFEYTVLTTDLDTNGIVVSSAIQLNGARLTDIAGNNSGLTFAVPSTAGILVDGVAPTVTRFSSTKPNGLFTVAEIIPLTVTMSETVAAGSTIEVTLNTGAIVALTTTAASKTLTGNYVVGTGENTVDLDVASYSDQGVFDLSGNALSGTTLPTGVNSLAGSKQIAIDTTAPTVTGFSSTTPAGTYGVAATIAINATLSEPVKAGGTLSAVLNTGATVVLTAATQGVTLTGTLIVGAGQNTSTLAVVSFVPGTAVDLAGNAIVDTTLPSAAISDSVVIAIDTMAPTVVGFGSPTADGSYIGGREIDIIATLSETVVAGSTLGVTLDTGRSVTLIAATAGTTLSGKYTVAAGDYSPDLTVASFTAGNVTDLVGNRLTSTIVPANNIDVSKAIVVDALGPAVTVTSDKASVGGPNTATITFALDEPATLVDATKIVTVGGTLSPLTGSGTNFSATFTPTPDSTTPATITVQTGAFADMLGNLSRAAALSPPIVVDTVAPTVEITADKTALKAGDTTLITFTLSEPSTNFTRHDLTLIDGEVTDFTPVSSTVYTAIFTPTPDKLAYVQVQVPAGSFTDAAGNGNLFNRWYVLSDTLRPTVKIETSKTALKAGEEAKITFTTSEATTDFTDEDVAVTGGELIGFTGSGRNYSAIFKPTADSTAPGVISITSNTFTDPAGNGNEAGSLNPAITIDTIVPTATIQSDTSTLKIGETATITITISEPTTDFTMSDIVVTGGTLSGFTGSGTSYSALFTPAANFTGLGTFLIPAGSFHDAAGNPNPAYGPVTLFSIDTEAPTVEITADKTALKAGETALITVRLSEPSTDFARHDLTLIDGEVTDFTPVSSTVYTAIFTPTPDKLAYVQVQVPAGSFTDAAGNGNLFSRWYVLSDTAHPTGEITTDKAALKAGETARITFKLSEPTTNFELSDITFTGGTLSGFTGSGTNYSATFRPTANSNAPGAISVAAGRFTDAAGNPNKPFSLTPPIRIDTVLPTVTITADRTALKAGETALITVRLSETITDFTMSDIVVTGGTLSGFTESGTSYSVVFTPAANFTGPGTFLIPAGSFHDAAGNPNPAYGPVTLFSIDTEAPTVEITTDKAALKAGETARITFKLSEPATNFALSDITFTGGTLSGFTGSGTNYSATFTPTADSNAPGAISVAAGRFTDAAGNGNTAGSLTPPIRIDTVRPTVEITADKTALKAGDTTVLTFTLSEPSNNFTEEDLTLIDGTIVPGSFTKVSDTVYTAIFIPTPDKLAYVQVQVLAGSFTDAAGNGNLFNRWYVLSDTVRPTVTGFSTSAPSGSYSAGTVIGLRATISEPVKAGSAFEVTLNTGAVVTLRAAVDGPTLSGDYVVAAGQNTSLLAVTSYTAGSVTDLAGNPLTVAAPPGAGLGARAVASNIGTTIVIDTIAPTLVGFSSSLANGTYGTGTVIPLTATLSEDVRAGGQIQVKLDTGALVTLRAATAGNILTGSYTVSPGEVATDLDITSYQLTGNSVLDTAGNVMTTTALPASGGRLATVKQLAIDATIRVTSPGFSVNPGVIANKGIVRAVPIVFSTPVTGVSLAAFRLYFKNRSVSLRGASITGSGANYMLRLPAALTRTRGIYRLEILETTGIAAAANGAQMTQTAQIFWGNGVSLAPKPTARAAAFRPR